MRASHRAEFFRQGESDHEVANRQQQVFLVIEPLVRLIILALWTVAVLAGVVAVEALLALVTEIELAAKRLGAAVFDSVHRPEMRRRHPVSELRPIFRTMEAEDVGDLDHQRSLIRRLMRSAASCSALTVRCV